MRQSELFTKTLKEAPKEEQSAGLRFLIRAGFIDKTSAGIYAYLPLGLRVIKNIENIVREEINAIGGQEVLMPALTPKENWQKTGRWQSFDALFKLKGHDEKEYALGATHEEIVTPLLQKFILSYKDLPRYVYQIQTKFRNEPRAKAGLLRGREFLMKDLYSFHADENDLNEYYEKVKIAYLKIFERCGLTEKTFLTLAGGGTFSQYSHEFQTVCPVGEDTIFICAKCHLAVNKEIQEETPRCPECHHDKFEEEKTIEIANIFKLKTNYSAPFDLKFKDQNGQAQPVLMGCYGLGISRLMGALAENNCDSKGLKWPAAIAPFRFHLLALGEDKAVRKSADDLYQKLQQQNCEVLYDDRDLNAGEKFADADLIGLPARLVISQKTLAKKSVEIKQRNEEKSALIKLLDLKKIISFTQ